MAFLKWIKSTSGTWLSLSNVDLSSVTSHGVYVIWHSGNPSVVVRVGQGNIKDRLQSHRLDSEITAYASKGTLKVTWATVPANQMDGVEQYLVDTWHPLVADAYPDAPPIVVNSPFG